MKLKGGAPWPCTKLQTRWSWKKERGAVTNISVLFDQTSLQNILGLTGFYRELIKNFTEISTVLYSVMSKTTGSYWNDFMKGAFDKLKKKFISPFVVELPDFKLQFILESNASLVAVVVASCQKRKHGNFHPVSYSIPTINKSERRWSACWKETLAVIFVLTNFSVYLLLLHSFSLFTDHYDLLHIFKEKRRFTYAWKGGWTLWLNKNSKLRIVQEITISKRNSCSDKKSKKRL